MNHAQSDFYSYGQIFKQEYEELKERAEQLEREFPQKNERFLHTNSEEYLELVNRNFLCPEYSKSKFEISLLDVNKKLL